MSSRLSGSWSSLEDVLPITSVASSQQQSSSTVCLVTSGHERSLHKAFANGLFGDTFLAHFEPSLREFHLNSISFICLVKCPMNWSHNLTSYRRGQILPDGTATSLLAPFSSGGSPAPGCSQGWYPLPEDSLKAAGSFQPPGKSAKGALTVVCDSKVADCVLFERSWPKIRWEIATVCLIFYTCFLSLLLLNVSVLQQL